MTLEEFRSQTIAKAREQREAVKHAVLAAERRLEQLDSKGKLTRSEEFEREMTVNCIERGKDLLRKMAE